MDVLVRSEVNLWWTGNWEVFVLNIVRKEWVFIFTWESISQFEKACLLFILF